MSTAKIGFNQLPEAGEVKNGDFFVIEDVVQAKKINFKNIIFGLENVTFASTLSAQSTDIVSLSANVESLSGQLYNESNSLTSLLNTTVQSATAAFVNVLFPIGTVIYTAVNTNPGTYITNTVWDQVAQGLFIAGVGSGVDKNGNGFVVGEGLAANNFNTGEYEHQLTIDELPSHTHNFRPIEGQNTSVAGAYTESAAGPGARLAAITSDSTGGNLSHNNIPPLYGLYVWSRIG